MTGSFEPRGIRSRSAPGHLQVEGCSAWPYTKSTYKCSLDGLVSVQTKSLCELDSRLRLTHVVLALARRNRICLVNSRTRAVLYGGRSDVDFLNPRVDRIDLVQLEVLLLVCAGLPRSCAAAFGFSDLPRG